MSSKRKSPPTKLDGSNSNAESKLSSEDVDVMPSAEIDLSIKSSPHLSDTETNNDHRISPELEQSSEVNHRNQLNGERMSGKVKRRGGDNQVRKCQRRMTPYEYLINIICSQSLSQTYFHQSHPNTTAALPHALQNLLSKRRKSENFDNVPSIHSPLNHSPQRDELSHNNNQCSSGNHNLINEIDETKIKREPNASDQNENEFDLVGNYNNNNHVDNDVKRDLMGSSKKTMNDVLKLLTNKMRGSSLKDFRKGANEQDFESKM